MVHASMDLDGVDRAQSEDDGIKLVINCFRAGTLQDQVNVRQYPEEARLLFGQLESPVICDDTVGSFSPH